VIKKALIVRIPYAGMIVDGIKTFEMRSTSTKIRGTVGVIEAGTGLIIGEVNIRDSIKFSLEERKNFQRFHKVEDLSLLEKWCWGWFITDAKRYKKPKKYVHPQGAVIWVNL